MEPQVRVNEYRYGKLVHQWDSVTDAAKHHKVAYALIKTLCATGNPLPNNTESITFDTPYESIYSYEMVRTEEGKLIPTLVVDISKKSC